MCIDITQDPKVFVCLFGSFAFEMFTFVEGKSGVIDVKIKLPHNHTSRCFRLNNGHNCLVQMFLFPLGLQIFMDGSAAAFVQPGLQQRKVSVHPADVILDGLVGLPDTPQL